MDAIAKIIATEDGAVGGTPAPAASKEISFAFATLSREFAWPGTFRAMAGQTVAIRLTRLRLS